MEDNLFERELIILVTKKAIREFEDLKRQAEKALHFLPMDTKITDSAYRKQYAIATEVRMRVLYDLRILRKQYDSENGTTLYADSVKDRLRRMSASRDLFRPHKSRVEQLNIPHLINHWRVITSNNYDSWQDVYVFDSVAKENVKHVMECAGIEVDGSTWTSAYDCTGRSFYYSAEFYVTKNRVFVVHRGAIDV